MAKRSIYQELRLSRRLRILLTIVAGALAVTVGVVVMITPTTTVASGNLLRETDFSHLALTAFESDVGDTVMFMGALPSVVGEQSVEITDVVAKGSPGLKFVGAGIYRTKDFDGAAVAVWHSTSGDMQDPRRHAHEDLVGRSLFSAADRTAEFVLYEFVVCAAGNLAIDQIDLTYRHASQLYRETLHVRFEVSDAAQSSFQC